MPKLARCIGCSFWLVAGLASLAIGSEPPEPREEPGAIAEEAAPSTAELARWAVELDDEQFEVREAATRGLQAAGKPALDVISQTAAGESLEASSRAFVILGKLAVVKDADTQAAAKQALEKLSKHAEPPVARRAAATLAKSQRPAAEQVAPQAAAIARAIPGGARVELRVVGGLLLEGKAVRVHAVRIDAGGASRKAEVNRNGEKIVIEENPKTGITIKVTNKKDGKEQTTEYAAKTVEELKKTPAAFKLYEQYLGKGGVRLEVFGVAEPPKAKPPKAESPQAPKPETPAPK